MKIKKYWVFLLISFFLVGCDSLLKVDFLKKLNQDVIASLKIGQSEVIGSCVFNSSSQNVNNTNFSYLLSFSKEINSAVVSTQTISNVGTGGATDLNWAIQDCGDGQNFKIAPTLIVGDGTIAPDVSNIIAAVSSPDKGVKLENDINQIVVNYDTQAPSISINQSSSENIGSCNFTGTNDPTNIAGFSYKITFSEKVNPATFLVSDITNTGTGAGSSLVWGLENCGDNQNFKLTANSLAGDGTVIPVISSGVLTDLAGNMNTISLSVDNSITYDTSSLLVAINQSITEVVGSCSFSATTDPTNVAGFSYKVVFSEVINAASFTVADIANTGTGGGTILNWALVSCGDNQNFKLTANTISGDGTIVPVVSAGGVSDLAGNVNMLSTSTDNRITYDTVSPSITVSRSVAEIVGTCSFTATNAIETAAGFDFKVVFSEKIDDSSFAVSDVTNSGTGGATTLTWSLANCGDDQNYRLTVSAISGEGTIIPQILASNVTDVTGNQNTLSSSSNGTVTYKLLGWKNEAYIKAANNGVSDSFGNTVSISGDTLVVGATQEDSGATTITNGTGFSGSDSSTLSDIGAVYVYKRTGTSWGQEAYIKAVNSGLYDIFSTSLSISGDTLAVGASQEDSGATTITNGAGFSEPGTKSNAGAVYIYKRIGNNWAQEAYVKASNSAGNDYFGNSVSLSGNTLAVGAYNEDFNATTITNGTGFSGADLGATDDSGAVYVYKRTGTSWAQEAYIKAVNNGANDQFGASVSLSGDTVSVGAVLEDSNATTITNGAGFSGADLGATDNSGAVYIYKRTGSSWAQEAYIKAVNNEANDYFGNSVSISGDTLAVGARLEDSNATTITNGTSFSEPGTAADSGAVYIYKRTGNSWAQEAYIKAINNGASDYFGNNVSLVGDTLAVGVYNEDSNATTITNGAGFSGADLGATDNSGAVYIYKRTGNSWAQEAYIKAVNNGANDYFGNSVSISGDTLAVGARLEDSNATTITNGAGFSEPGQNTDSGAVYIFRNNARLFAVTEIFPVVTSNSISLKWNKTGGTAVGYGVNLELGIVTPPLCSLSMDYDLGNNNELLLESLTADTDYSLRFCVYDGSNQFVEDKIINLKTNP